MSSLWWHIWTFMPTWRKQWVFPVLSALSKAQVCLVPPWVECCVCVGVPFCHHYWIPYICPTSCNISIAGRGAAFEQGLYDITCALSHPSDLFRHLLPMYGQKWVWFHLVTFLFRFLIITEAWEKCYSHNAISVCPCIWRPLGKHPHLSRRENESQWLMSDMETANNAHAHSSRPPIIWVYGGNRLCVCVCACVLFLDLTIYIFPWKESF